MAETIYLLCTGTALVCCVLLFRGYRQTRARLLLWSGLCFATLTLENFFLFLDRIIFLSVDLSPLWTTFSFVAVLFLLHGLIWKDKK
jgi:Family of unknown function (DUF5985)